MPDKYQNKYRIPSARLQTWDYGSSGDYFITVCTAKRQHYFGQILNGNIELSDQGKIANQHWLEIPNHFSFVTLDEFVVMPNHIHGIIVIENPFDNENFMNDAVETRHALSLQQPNPSLHTEPTKQPTPRFRNQGENPISLMVSSYKFAVTKHCNENKLPFGWQSRFHDHIVRDNNEFHRIKNYILCLTRRIGKTINFLNPIPHSINTILIFFSLLASILKQQNNQLAHFIRLISQLMKQPLFPHLRNIFFCCH